MKNKSGFTLVELSIVLVIIGLLIGGILAAQSMIGTAKTMNLVRTLQQYEVAAQNFKTTYKYYPGDAVYFSPAGNQNNTIDTAGACTDKYSGEESSQVFAHLVASNMLKGNYIPFSPTSCNGGHNNNPSHPSLSGITGPATELNKAASNAFGSGKPAITAGKLPESPSYFHYVLVLDRNEGLAFLSKLGNPDLAPVTTTVPATGAMIQNCYMSNNTTTTACKDAASTVYMRVVYAMENI